MEDFKWKRRVEKDKGPVITWIATKISSILIAAEMKIMPYTEMWELDLDDELSVPHNQMSLEEIEYD